MIFKNSLFQFNSYFKEFQFFHLTTYTYQLIDQNLFILLHYLNSNVIKK